MTTAVDTNILLDVFVADSPYHAESASALRVEFALGALCISEVVYAELAPWFAVQDELDTALRQMGIAVVGSGTEAAWQAGRTWAEYRRRGGPKRRVLADLLIGAHATCHADRLLTRDRGFYRTYFKELVVIQPQGIAL